MQRTMIDSRSEIFISLLCLTHREIASKIHDAMKFGIRFFQFAKAMLGKLNGSHRL